jgi:hypothetical protein
MDGEIFQAARVEFVKRSLVAVEQVELGGRREIAECAGEAIQAR